MTTVAKPDAALVRPTAVDGRLSDAELRDFVAGPYPSILAVVALAADSRAAAEDAVHEALARAWERGGIEHLDRWVLAVALNLSRSRWRKVGRERPLSERPNGGVPDEHEDVDLRDALRELPRRQREAVVLHYLVDMPVAEIASVTGLSEGGVKHALFRGRRSLASALAGEEEEVDASAVADSVAARVGRRRRRRVVVRGTALVVALLGLVPVVARMASDKGERVEVASGTVDGLLGRTFVSVSATEGGEPYALAAGTRLVLTFRLDRWFQADAGCNEFGGRLAEESEHTLVVERGEMHTTLIDCPDRRAQEAWFSRLLGDEPTVVHGGGRLVLTAGDRRVELVEGGVDAARTLIGRTWTVEWVIADPSKSPAAPVHPATMVFTESGFRISSHCEEGVGTIEWSRGTMRVGGWRREGFPCDGQQEEPDVVAALETGLFLLEVSETHTTLRNASGRGVMLRAP